MKFTFIKSALITLTVFVFSSFQSMAVDMHGVMCGGEIRPADQTVVDQFNECSVSLAKIETHFFQNNCFIEENEIIKNINKIKNIRCEIVHGRYDIVCPFKQAYDLHSSYPNSRLNIINDAGHSLLEPGISEKILYIFNFKTLYLVHYELGRKKNRNFKK